MTGAGRPCPPGFTAGADGFEPDGLDTAGLLCPDGLETAGLLCPEGRDSVLLGLAAGEDGFETVPLLPLDDLTDDGFEPPELLPRDTADLLSEREPLLLLV